MADFAQTDQKGSARPRERVDGADVGERPQSFQLLVSDDVDLLLERQLPRVQLQHLSRGVCVRETCSERK